MRDAILAISCALGAWLIAALIHGHRTVPRCPDPNPSSVEELFAPCQAVAAEIEKRKVIASFRRAQDQVVAYLR